MKFIKIIFGFVFFGMLCFCGIAGMLYYNWQKTGPPSPPNYFQISPTVHGLVMIVSPKNHPSSAFGTQTMKIDHNFMMLKDSFTANIGTWNAKIGGKEFKELSPNSANPNQEGVWSIGTVTDPVIPDHFVFTLYVGKAKDALTAGTAKAIKSMCEGVAARLKSAKA